MDEDKEVKMRALAFASFVIAAIFAVMVGSSIVVGGESMTPAGAALVLIPLAAGFVFLVLDPRLVSAMATPMRVASFIVGVLIVYGGLFWVSYVEEYGGGNWMTETANGQVRVYEVNEDTGSRTLVFTGTQAEADRWIDEQRQAASDTTWPWITVGIGGLVLAGSITLGWRRADGQVASDQSERHVTA